MLNRNIFEVLEAAGDPYCSIDMQQDGKGRIAAANDAFLELLQVDRNDLIGQEPARAFEFLNNLPELSAALDQVFKGRSTESILMEFLLSSSILVSWHAKCIPVISEEQVDGVILLVNHISKRTPDDEPVDALSPKQLSGLRYWSDKYKEVLRCVVQPMWIYDLGSMFFVDVNEAAIRHYGYTYDEFMGMTIRDIKLEEDMPELEEDVFYLKQFGGLFTQQGHRHKKRNGDLIYVELSSTPIYILGRKCALVMVNDITLQMLANKTIAAYHDRVVLAQKLAQLGYWELNLDTSKVFWSEEMYTLWEQDRSIPAPLPDDFVQTIYPGDREMFREYQRRMIEEGDLSNCEFRIITRKGNVKHVGVQLSIMLDEGRRPCLVKGTVQDISRQKEAEYLLQKRSVLLEAIGNFNKSLLENLPWESQLYQSLGLLAGVLSADKVYYFEHITDRYTGNSSVLLQSCWQAGGRRGAGLEQMLDVFLGRYLVILAGRQHADLHVAELEDGVLRTQAQAMGISTLRAIPVFVNELLHGFLAVEYSSEEKQWSDAEVSFLEAVGNSLTIAIKRHIAEQAVLESQQQFRSLVNNVPGITYRCLMDRYWTMLFISEEVERLLGYKAEDFIYNQLRSFVSVMHPEDVAKDSSRIAAELSQHGRFRAAYRLIKSDGDTVWVEDRGIASYDKTGKLLWIDGVILEVTDRRAE